MNGEVVLFCGACSGPFVADEWEGRHTGLDGADIHDRCCELEGPCSLIETMRRGLALVTTTDYGADYPNARNTTGGTTRMTIEGLPVVAQAVIDLHHPDGFVQFTGRDAEGDAIAYAEYNGCAAPLPVVDFRAVAVARG